MGVKHAQRVLGARHVAAKRQEGLVGGPARVPLAVDAPHHRRHRVVRRAVRVVRDHAHRLVGPAAPGVDHVHAGVEQLLAAVGAQAQHAHRPLEHRHRHARERLERKRLGHRRVHHRELVGAALEVVVRQDRAAHHRQVGVGANEVLRQQVHKVEQARDGLAVDVHVAVMHAHRDAVLVEVGVGAVLQAPALAAELDGHDAQVLARRVRAARGLGRAARVALVLDAELAGRVLLARVSGGAGTGDVARVLLGLGAVDRDLEAAPVRGRLPGDVARDGGAAHVADVAAQVIEPTRGHARSLAREGVVEGERHLGGAGREQPHHPHGRAVAPGGGVLGRTVRDGLLREARERALEVERGGRHRAGGALVGLGRVGVVADVLGDAHGKHRVAVVCEPRLGRGGAGCAHGLEHRVVGPDPVLAANQVAVAGVVDKRTNVLC